MLDDLSYIYTRRFIQQELRETGSLNIPAGDIVLSETVDLGTLNGLHIKGVGKTNKKENGPNLTGCTKIIWNGPEHRPMFRGCIRNFLIENVTFVNGTFHIDSKRGFGSGHGVFNNVSQLDHTVLLGNPRHNGNAADITWRDCYYSCGEAPCIQNTTSQNINYRIYNPFIVRTDTFFNVKGGGNITLRDGYCKDVNRLFVIHGNGSVFGRQNGRITVDGLDYDQDQSSEELMVCHDLNGYYGFRRGNFYNISSPNRKLVLVKHYLDTEWRINEDGNYNVILIVPS